MVPLSKTSGESPVNRRRLRFWLRAVLVVSGVCLIGLLAVAAWLDPDPQQFGTHQQLGLPPCSIQEFFGIRCPSCGMTTSWAHMMNLQPWQSVRANSGGALLAIVALLAGPWMLASGLRGDWIGGPLNEWLVVAISLGIAAVTLIEWAIRLNQ